jgi:tetratricopeptide (TPR) repeat protein
MATSSQRAAAAQAANNETAFNKLIQDLQKSITDETEEFRRDGMTAQLLMAQNQHAEAIPFFERAVTTLRTVSKKKPNLWKDYYVRVLGSYAMTLDFVGQLDAAEKIYHECLQVNPAGFFLGEYAVFLHRRKRDFVQAQAYYERSLQLYPAQSSIHLKYAAFLRHVRRDLAAAEHHYKLAIETNTRNPDAVGSYASFLHGVIGDAPLAETYYREAVELDRTHANNLCNYGLFLSEEKKNFTLAEDLYKQVLLHTPRHANTLYNYAVMLDSHLEGRKLDAEGFYRRAIEVEPRHAFALYNLAVLLEDRVMLAEPEDAREEDKLRKREFLQPSRPAPERRMSLPLPRS